MFFQHGSTVGEFWAGSTTVAGTTTKAWASQDSLKPIWTMCRFLWNIFPAGSLWICWFIWRWHVNYLHISTRFLKPAQSFRHFHSWDKWKLNKEFKSRSKLTSELSSRWLQWNRIAQLLTKVSQGLISLRASQGSSQLWQGRSWSWRQAQPSQCRTNLKKKRDQTLVSWVPNWQESGCHFQESPRD